MPGLFVALAIFGFLAFAATGALVPKHDVDVKAGETWRVSGMFSPPIPLDQQANFQTAFTTAMSVHGQTLSGFTISSDSFSFTVTYVTVAQISIGTVVSVAGVSLTITSAVRVS